MANTVSASWTMVCTAVETLDMDLGNTTFANYTSDPTYTNTITGQSGTLTATSTVPATKSWQATIPLAAGTYTIDLTALATYQNQALSLSGLKVQLFQFVNAGAADMTIAEGAANPYWIFGGLDGNTIKVNPGGCVMFYSPDKNPDVAAGAKDILVTGTGTESFKVLIIAG